MIATFFVPLEKPWKEDGWQYVRPGGTYGDSGDLSPIPTYTSVRGKGIKPLGYAHDMGLSPLDLKNSPPGLYVLCESNNELKVFLKDDSYFHYTTRILVNDLRCDTT